MNNKLYDMIFKRKSFHLFRNIGNDIEKKDFPTVEEKLNDLEVKTI